MGFSLPRHNQSNYHKFYMKIPYFSVYIPTYNNSFTIASTINSVLNQTFKDFEIIVRDDNSKDDTLSIVRKFHDLRLIIKKNRTNHGYSNNLNHSLIDCHSDNIFLLAGDDLLDKRALEWYHKIYKDNPGVGAITRPYYWFDNDFRVPVRLKKTVSGKSNLLVSTHSSITNILLILSTLDQCSGLCFKRNLTKQKFNQNPWISHAYPWLDIFKNHSVAFLKKYPLAVYIGNSATRSNIYQKSPMISWKNMIDSIFYENKFKKLRSKIIKNFIATNYVGLVQIKNYGSYKSYLREVYYLIKLRPLNLLNVKFWTIFIITILTPPKILRLLTDKFKSKINKNFIKQNIVIDLSL